MKVCMWNMQKDNMWQIWEQEGDKLKRLTFLHHKKVTKQKTTVKDKDKDKEEESYILLS